jgi:hypothetical protein
LARRCWYVLTRCRTPKSSAAGRATRRAPSNEQRRDGTLGEILRKIPPKRAIRFTYTASCTPSARA